MTVRVLIADDQQLVRAGFKLILSNQPDIDVVAEAETGSQAVERALAIRPDIVLMDIRMPGMDGIEATRRIVSRGQGAIRVLILTTYDLDEYVYDALRAGASGFLLKDVPPEQLAVGIRMVCSGDALLAPSVTRRLIEEFTAARTEHHSPPGMDDLSPREQEVFVLLTRGWSNLEIADHLFVGESTIKTHVTRILGKLGLRDRVQAVVLAYEAGIVTPGQSNQ
jgi:DNA-binding NarL/FixJ family response regulator